MIKPLRVQVLGLTRRNIFSIAWMIGAGLFWKNKAVESVLELQVLRVLQDEKNPAVVR